eukprot:CAMPEP_0180372324 /NCGR_PEP_ID=MMETSP0989-20121125/20439_1 /TAXON_ID=697907 /ORGANISM="non described non described, Strain CCMP2293" /LENGTH=135 /DNA_ID=CAMNT_0022368701 /DNA_START=84 /DNA_END=493 /DNA_ORIENTATION=-
MTARRQSGRTWATRMRLGRVASASTASARSDDASWAGVRAARLTAASGGGAPPALVGSIPEPWQRRQSAPRPPPQGMIVRRGGTRFGRMAFWAEEEGGEAFFREVGEWLGADAGQDVALQEASAVGRAVGDGALD